VLLQHPALSVCCWRLAAAAQTEKKTAFRDSRFRLTDRHTEAAAVNNTSFPKSNTRCDRRIRDGRAVTGPYLVLSAQTTTDRRAPRQAGLGALHLL